VWELTHFLFHIGLGYYYNLPVSIAISVGFELYEHCFKDCGSWLDLLYNGLGGIVGVALYHFVNRKAGVAIQ
jgi:hypothetical protein